MPLLEKGSIDVAYRALEQEDASDISGLSNLYIQNTDV